MCGFGLRQRSRQRLGRAATPAALGQLLSIPRLSDVQADVHLFTTQRLPALSGNVTVHAQRGRAFGERLENAVQTLAARGYDRIVIVGRDCPQLAASDVREAIDALASHRLVLGPDHRGGCWLIAFHARDRAALLAGVQWQRNVDFAELASRVNPCDLLQLSVKIDLDGWNDARLLALLDADVRRLLETLLTIGAQSAAPLFHPILAFARHQRPPPSLPSLAA